MTGSSNSETTSDHSLSADFDIETLRKKYRRERDKRLRDDGTSQYAQAIGEFGHYVDDPYVEPGFDRPPINEVVDVVVIGGGFAGLSASAHMRLADIGSIRIIEKGGDFGGTWYWNRYPGVQCDIESYIYLPLLEETGYFPREKYSHGPEILEHAQRIGVHFDLYNDALFQTEVRELRWLEDERRWLVTTTREDLIKARYVVQTNGLLDRPKLPSISGIGSFKGHTFHTSRWDYDYTGGDTGGNLTKLRDKRVAVIGTGATGIQCVPYIARDAGHLYVVQRTPSSVDERRNGPTDWEWVKTLEPGWQKRRRDNFVTLTSGGVQDEDLVSDGWTDAVRSLGGFAGTVAGRGIAPDEMARLMEIADFRKMNSIRSRVDTIVQDRRTADALKPWYRQFCKRPTFNDGYLPAFNCPNVSLIDTDGRGPDRFYEEGIVCAGIEYPLDCAIFATGFEFGTAFAASSKHSGHEIYGRGGTALSAAWATGLKTLHGYYSHGFPNLFHMGRSQNGSAFIVTYYLDEQAQHIADVLKVARIQGATCIEPTNDAVNAWVEEVNNKSNAMREFQRQCTPGYYNNEGKDSEVKTIFDEVYGGSPVAFYEMVRQWRQGDLAGLDIT